MLRLIIAILLLFPGSAFSEQETTLINAPALFNGTKSVPGEFLPMGFLGMCTATAVSDQVIFTAAHCVSTGQTVRFQSRFDGKTYQARCTNHPQYNSRTTMNDWSLCKVSGALPAEMPYASFLEKTPAVGEKLLLNGYGAPTVGTHHWGPAEMSSVRGQDIVVCNRVSLGGGDSGGSLLKWSEDRSGKSGFQVVGVNSRRQVGGNCSYFNRMSDPSFGNWVRQYEGTQGVKICGISRVCTGATPPPPPPPPPTPEPVNCWKTYEEFAFCIGTKNLAQCLSRADVLKACVL